MWHYLLFGPLRGPLIYMVVSSNGRQWAGEKKSDSDVGEEEREALASAANDEADRWIKTRRERLNDWGWWWEEKGEKEIVHFGPVEKFSIFSLVIHQGVVPFSRDIEPFHQFIVRADLASGRDFHLAAESAEISDFEFLLHFWTNWGTSKMRSSKAPRASDSRLRQVTTKDRGARRPWGALP